MHRNIIIFCIQVIPYSIQNNDAHLVIPYPIHPYIYIYIHISCVYIYIYIYIYNTYTYLVYLTVTITTASTRLGLRLHAGHGRRLLRERQQLSSYWEHPGVFMLLYLYVYDFRFSLFCSSLFLFLKYSFHQLDTGGAVTTRKPFCNKTISWQFPRRTKVKNSVDTLLEEGRSPIDIIRIITSIITSIGICISINMIIHKC